MTNINKILFIKDQIEKGEKFIKEVDEALGSAETIFKWISNKVEADYKRVSKWYKSSVTHRFLLAYKDRIAQLEPAYFQDFFDGSGNLKNKDEALEAKLAKERTNVDNNFAINSKNREFTLETLNGFKNWLAEVEATLTEEEKKLLNKEEKDVEFIDALQETLTELDKKDNEKH